MANHLAETIKKLRKQESLTQVQLAGQLNLERGNLAKYERALSIPSIDVISEIADFFGVSIDFIVNGNSQKSPSDNFSIRENELMADNCILMEKIIALESTISSKNEEIELLKKMLKSSQDYISYLENKT